MIWQEIRAQGWKYACLIALVAVGVQSCRLDVSQKALSIAATKQVKAERDAYKAALEEKQTRERYIAGVDAAYQRGLTDAQAKGDRVAADLRAGALQLRKRWQGCEARHLPGSTAGAGKPDAAADDRASSAGRAIGAGAKADEQIRCLQAIALIDRGMDPGDLSKGCPSQ